MPLAWDMRENIILFNKAETITSHASSFVAQKLTHWGRVTHICVSKLTIIGSDNGLSPGRRQAIIWTNAGLLLIGPLGTNFSEILIAILTFSSKKMRLKVSSAKRRLFCLGLNELRGSVTSTWDTFLITTINYTRLDIDIECLPTIIRYWNDKRLPVP